MTSEPTENPSLERLPARNFWGRRVLGILVDWFASMAVALVFFAGDPLANLVIFAVTTWVLQATLGTTIGHRLVGVATRTEAGTAPGFRRALIRTVALCLLIPPVITDAHGRGLHERWSGTHIVPLR